MKKIIVFLLFNLVGFNTFSQNIRDPRDKGIANVYWDGTYQLYSLTSDEPILPNQNDEYTFWATTNENPIAEKFTLKKGKTLYFYKFITETECIRFCNTIRKNKGMSLLEEESHSPVSYETRATDNSTFSIESFRAQINAETDVNTKLTIIRTVNIEASNNNNQSLVLEAFNQFAAIINEYSPSLEGILTENIEYPKQWFELMSEDFITKGFAQPQDKDFFKLTSYLYVVCQAKIDPVSSSFNKEIIDLILNNFTEDTWANKDVYEQLQQSRVQEITSNTTTKDDQKSIEQEKENLAQMEKIANSELDACVFCNKKLITPKNRKCSYPPCGKVFNGWGFYIDILHTIDSVEEEHTKYTSFVAISCQPWLNIHNYKNYNYEHEIICCSKYCAGMLLKCGPNCY